MSVSTICFSSKTAQEVWDRIEGIFSTLPIVDTGTMVIQLYDERGIRGDEIEVSFIDVDTLVIDTFGAPTKPAYLLNIMASQVRAKLNELYPGLELWTWDVGGQTAPGGYIELEFEFIGGNCKSFSPSFHILSQEGKDSHVQGK